MWYVGFLENKKTGIGEIIRNCAEKIIMIDAPDDNTALDAFKQGYANMCGYNDYDCLVSSGDMWCYTLQIDYARRYKSTLTDAPTEKIKYDDII